MDISLFAVVMTFGVLVAGCGLVLLFLRKEQGENKIKLFGQEFQISTPALVVFLAGCAVFVVPLVIPVQNTSVISFGHPDGSQNSPEHPNLTAHGASTTDAALIPIGKTIQGQIVGGQDRHFFKFKTSARDLRIRIIVRKTAKNGFWANVVVYDNAENRVDSGYTLGEDPVSFAFDCNPNSSYYIKVEGNSSGDRGPYELLVKAE